LESVARIGVRVQAPFGSKRAAQGVIINVHKTRTFRGKTRTISRVVDDAPILDGVLWELLNRVGRHYLTPLGQVMRTAVPQGLTGSYVPPTETGVRLNGGSREEMSLLERRAPGQFRVMKFLEKREDTVSLKSLRTEVKNPLQICRALEKKGLVTLVRQPKRPGSSALSFAPIEKEVVFTADQEKVVRQLEAGLISRRYTPCLLHGVTGSGKTEIYIHLARRAEEQGRTSIVLLPEISLTPQVAGRFRGVFGDRVAIWHSRMSTLERAWTWRQMCAGEFTVVVGARSAVFTPVRDVGLIVVDEEQENAYKQEAPAPRYHARDVALMRGKLSHALTVLASATPSLESYHDHMTGKLNYIPLKTRYGQSRYPRVHIVDMMKEREEVGDYGVTLSRLLTERITETLERGEQVILLQNRRGFSPIVSCRDCGHVEMCRNCKISLTYHKAEHGLKCHYCNYRKPVPDTCESCRGIRLLPGGVGTQKVEEALMGKFPDIRLVRMDLDTTRRRGAHVRILERFNRREYDVLLGTQMIAKGLDFENVTLVGVISADTGIHLPDFRAGERTFQLIYQVAGRSGRGRKPGEAIIQTNNPDNAAIRLAATRDLERYYALCLDERRELMYPPFGWMTKVEFRGRNREATERQAMRFRETIGTAPPPIEVLGPAPCPIERIRQYYRYQIIFKSSREKDKEGRHLHRFLEKTLPDSPLMKTRKGVTVHVDVDAVSFL
ncbi:MAG: primosomal protein N', partial [Fidelibacterota bacterium]